MASQVNLSKSASEATLLNTAWQAVMGNHVAAANRRRWSAYVLALLVSAILLFQAPASPALFARWLFSARSYGHVLAIGLGFFIALRAAASSQQAIFHIEYLKEAQKIIWRSAFGGRREPLDIGVEDSSLEAPETSFLHKGGPGQIRVDRGYLAVIEDYEGNSRVIGPSEAKTASGGFGHLRALIETKDQVATINFWGRTRDGIRVRVDSARIVYSLQRGNAESGLSDSQPADYDAALRVAYGRRIEPEQAMNPEFMGVMEEYGQAFFERQMQSFIAGLSFGELLSSADKKEEADAEDSRALAIKRETLKEDFASYYAAAGLEHGLELHWIDLGRWTIDELAQEIIDELQENPLHTSSVNEKASYQDSRADELNRLYSELAGWDRAKIASEDAPKQDRILAAYYGLFDGLKLRYGELLSEDEQQLDIVLRFLKVINLNLESNQ